jgi:hypothetical protein
VLTRRHALLLGAAVAAVAVAVPVPATAAPTAAPAAPTAPTAAALPAVDMAVVEVAAQVEGRYGNQPGLGDDAATRLVLAALTARGFPAAADGWFGRGTTAAYAAYQRSLGYTGIAANGLPGPASLRLLGTDRFTVTNVVSTGSTTDSYGGARVNTRTRRMLAAADAALPWDIRLDQGSYCAFGATVCDPTSAGTHDGGGVVDVTVTGLTSTQRWRMVRALRTVGFAAWLRTPAQCGGCWPLHIHAVAIGDPDLWQRDGGVTNRDQVADYYVGRNGLAAHAPDDTPAAYRVPFTWWERYRSSGG